MKRSLCIIILTTLIVFTGCSANSKSPMKQRDTKHIVKTDPIKSMIMKMSLEEKIGQLVFAGIDNKVMDEKSKELINEYKIGGIILFKRNIESSDQTISLINSLKTENAKNSIPLFLGIDQEGGRVSRLPKEFINTPSNKKIGAINSKDIAYKVGNIQGKQLNYLGFNLNFSPILDIDSNPNNPVIGNRAFSNDANIVSNLGESAINGMQSQNIIPVIKHFPGHGDTIVDSHIGLPKVDHNLKELDSFELVPFKKAIEKNIDMIMIGHIMLTKVDNKNPSTISKIVIDNILRDQLNFKGVVITDDMTMGAITKNYGIEEASISSIQAGSDIILVGHGHETILNVLNALKKAVQDGSIKEERINESVYRILKVKNKYKLNNEIHEKNPNEITSINNELDLMIKNMK